MPANAFAVLASLAQTAVKRLLARCLALFTAFAAKEVGAFAILTGAAMIVLFRIATISRTVQVSSYNTSR